MDNKIDVKQRIELMKILVHSEAWAEFEKMVDAEIESCLNVLRKENNVNALFRAQGAYDMAEKIKNLPRVLISSAKM